MGSLIKEADCAELAQYIVHTRSCVNAGSAYVLEGKFGLLSLNFEGLVYDECIVKAKRISGNGLTLFKSGDQSDVVRIVSKLSQDVLLVGGNKNIDISRPDSSVGTIHVLGVAFFSNGPIIGDWKSKLELCSEYQSVKLVNGQLIAAEGGFIKAGKIIRVSTDPPGMFSTRGNDVKFLGTCRIIELEFEPAIKQSKFASYPEIQTDETQVLQKDEQSPEPKNVIQKGALHQAKPVKNEINVLFDSKGKFSRAFGNDSISVESNYIRIGRMGQYSIPLRDVIPHVTYTIAVEVFKANGNGKFTFDIFPSSDTMQRPMIATAHKQLMTKTVVTPEAPDEAVFHLTFGRHPSSNGEVIVTRIMVMGDQPGSLSTSINVPLTASDIEHNYVGENQESKITRIFKNFSFLEPNKFTIEPINLSGSFELLNFSARQWMNKISTQCKFSEGGPADVVMCSVKALKAAPTVWLEEFGMGENISAIKSLEHARLILTPSLINKYKIKEVLPKAKITVVGRPWPWPKIDRPSVTNRYFIYFEKDPELTDFVLNNWNIDYGKLYIIGTRAKLPQFVQYISEYEPYENVCKLLWGAYGVLDISKNYHYISGILELACAMGVRVITNNHYYARRATIIRNNISEGIYGLTEEDFTRALAIGRNATARELGRLDYNKFISEQLTNLVPR